MRIDGKIGRITGFIGNISEKIRKIEK